MTILDELIYKEFPQYHPVTGEYTGTEYLTRICFNHGFLITKEAEMRGLKEHSLATSMLRSKEIIKELMLKNAMEILHAERINGHASKKILDHPVLLVVVREAEDTMLIIPPKEFVPLLKAFAKLDEEAEKKAYEKMTHDTQS